MDALSTCRDCGRPIIGRETQGARCGSCLDRSATREFSDRETQAEPGRRFGAEAGSTHRPAGQPSRGSSSGPETIQQSDEEAGPSRMTTLTFAPGRGLDEGGGPEGWGPEQMRLGGYLLIRELGRGGMGVVYEAIQLSLNRQVALKRIRHGALAGEKDLLRFQGEAEVIATLDHPNIVPIHEIGEHGGEHYFCMKLFEGKDLRSRLADFQDKPREIARLVATIARAVQYAHQRGVLHRDLKPSNILLDTDDQPHLIDFGLALRVDQIEESTSVGVVGTPHFMAPEQATGSNVATTLSDVYGLGGILYSLLTGFPPFEAKTTQALLKRVIEKDPIPPSERASGVDHDLEVICLKGLAKEPDLRYSTAKEMAEDLQLWLDGRPILARPHSRLERVVMWARRRPTIAALWAGLLITAVLGLVGIVAGLLLAMYHERQAIAREDEARHQAYLAMIRMGARDYHDANIGRLLETLQATGPEPGRADLRGFEWYYLRSLCHQDRVSVTASEEQLWGLDFDPEGSRIVVVGDDLMGQVRDSSTGRLIRSLVADDARGQDVAFHPNGREFVTSSSSGAVVLWDASTGQAIRAFVGFAGRALQVVVSPDGSRVAAGGERGQLLIWEVGSGRLLHNLKGHLEGSSLDNLAVSRDGKWLASSAQDNSIKIWDFEAGRLFKSIDGIEGLPRGLDFSDDGSKLAFGVGGRAVVLSTADWSRVREIRAEDSDKLICGLDFNADGTMLATGGFDQVVRVWDPASGRLIRSFKGHVDAVHDVKFHPRLRQVASSDAHGILKLWNLDDEQDARELRGQLGAASDIRFDPTGTWFATSGMDGSILMWDFATGKNFRVIRKNGATVRQISISPDGKRLASVGYDKAFRIFEAATGNLLHEVIEPEELECVGSSPDGRFFAFAGCGRDVKVWDVAQGRVVRTLHGHTDVVRGLSFSPDGSRLASSGTDSSLLVWDLTSGRLVGPEFVGTRDGVPVIAVAFSPDGRLVATSGRGRRVRLWDSRSGELLHDFQGHLDVVRGLAFSPDGRRLASSGADCLRLWDVEMGRELMAFEPFDVLGRAVAFSPDGKSLVSGDGGRTLKVRSYGVSH